MELVVRNVNEALKDALWYFKSAGIEEESRNGRVIVAPGPVMTTYQRPWERVLFSAQRDANPFFHFVEALWMLDGRNDAATLKHYNSRITDYSDDGATFNGAYGYRWREHFGHDQLEEVIHHLQKDPNSRRAVLGMWDPATDLLNQNSKDLPCNTQVFFDCRGGKLNMTVINRSNDAVWGAYGANAVHFSFLQEFVACALGRPIGVYRQFSNNLHVYPEKINPSLLDVPHCDDRYATVEPMAHYPLVQTRWHFWLDDLENFLREPSASCADPFFRDVAWPIFVAWYLRKAGSSTRDVLRALKECKAWDWRVACTEWVLRREK